MSAESSDVRAFVESETARLRTRQAVEGQLIAAIAYKRALVERLGVEQAFAAVSAHLPVPGIEVLKKRRLVSLREASEKAGCIRLLWEGGRPYEVGLKHVHGEHEEAILRGVSRSGYLACLDEVLVRGRAAVLMTGDEAIVDFENTELENYRDSPEQDPGVLCCEGSFYWTMDPAMDAPRIEEAFLLAGCHTNDFGHWLQEYLPRLALAVEAGLPAMPILVDELIPATHVQSLRLFCPERPVIVIPHLAPRRVRRLWTASNFTWRGWYPEDWSSAWEGMITEPRNFAFAIRKLQSMAGPALDADGGPERVFLARAPERKKSLVNHERIEEIARANGFVVVRPEQLNFTDQLRLVRTARRIIAPDGSNGLLSYFAGKGAKVCFLNHAHTLPLSELDGLLAALDVEFSVLTGPYRGEPQDEPFWNDYSIDEGEFAAFLRGWLP